ncbi:MAG: hydantoinase/oxoprolinase family protein, partial [Rhodobacteraceae bacterium]|nr:hydantoinase/oxoprolinase family protein [Paracoccaceae bacterium]
FKDAHRSRYGFVLEATVELVTLRVEAAGITESTPKIGLAKGEDPVAYRYHPVHFAAGTLETPLVDRATLGSSTNVIGPMVLTQLDTTLVVPPNWHGQVQESGAIILTRKGPVQ